MKSRDINSERFSWFFMEIIRQMWRSLMEVHGSIHQGKLAGRIYKAFEFYARHIVKCCRTFCIFAVFLEKKMSC